jgi:hypothetical protein
MMQELRSVVLRLLTQRCTREEEARVEPARAAGLCDPPMQVSELVGASVSPPSRSKSASARWPCASARRCLVNSGAMRVVLDYDEIIPPS